MTERYARIDSRKFRVFDINVRDSTQGILTGDMKRDSRNVSLLLATINAVNSVTGPRDAMRRFVDMLVQLTGAERGFLLLLRDGELKVDVIRHRDERDLPVTERYSRSIPLKVLETGKSIFYLDSLDEPEDLGESVSSLDLRAVMCAPLRVRDQSFGVVYVDSRYRENECREEDLSFFEAMCQQVAVTLENARLNQTMMDAERMATVGQMTSMVLHDLNNPMTVVSSYAQMIASGSEPPERIADMAHEIQDASNRVMELLRSVLDFARGGASYAVTPTNLSMLVRTAVGQLMSELGSRNIHVEIDLQYQAALPLDSHRMDRALTNLLVNAMEAIGRGGTLTVATRALETDRVELVITDSGKGIPDKIIGQIFEPFVTHGKARGTGLGLAIVKQIVDNHGGVIGVESTESTGTTITITLPTK